jgi:hypothetical protein
MKLTSGDYESEHFDFKSINCELLNAFTSLGAGIRPTKTMKDTFSNNELRRRLRPLPERLLGEALFAPFSHIAGTNR